MISVLLLAGIPWQLISSEDSLRDESHLEILTTHQIEQLGIWPQILGEADGHALPTDPHMIASPSPRAGLPLPAERWDPIHGHEIVRETDTELQYSCIFELPEPRVCRDDGQACLCDGEELPICRTENGAYGTTQRFAQAYPPPRLLEWAKALGTRATIGSICPKDAGAQEISSLSGDESLGYAAAFRTFARETYQSSFNGPNCFLNSLPLRADGSVNCFLLEAHRGTVDCSKLNRLTPPAGVAQEWKARIASKANQDNFTICEIPPFPEPSVPGSDLYACQNELHPALNADGYCYIDPSVGLGSESLVEMCAARHQRRLRVIPTTLPMVGTQTGLICDYGSGPDQ